MVSEIGFSEVLSLAQTIVIVRTLVLTLYFSKRHIQTRVLNDLDEKFHKMAEIIMEDPPIGNVIDKEEKPSRELAFSFYILWIFSHSYAMRQRKVLDVTRLLRLGAVLSHSPNFHML